jgi:RimJ/RimL family protein N-acetyltransferase
VPWTSVVIVTKRLTLRCPVDHDRPVIERILTDTEVRRFLGGPVSPDVVQAFASRPIDEQRGMFVAELRADAETIGTFSLEDERDDLELSFQLLPEHWGMGLAFEAAEALLSWGWGADDVDSIIAVTHSSNERSRRLLTRLGFAADCEFVEDGEPQIQVRLLRPG